AAGLEVDLPVDSAGLKVDRAAKRSARGIDLLLLSGAGLRAHVGQRGGGQRGEDTRQKRELPDGEWATSCHALEGPRWLPHALLKTAQSCRAASREGNQSAPADWRAPVSLGPVGRWKKAVQADGVAS